MLFQYHIDDKRSDSTRKNSPQKITQWYLVDLPGYGYAKVSQKQRNNFQQMIEGYLRKRENLKHVFVLLDGRHSPQKIDLDFLHDLGKWNIPFSLVFTKIDKEKQTEYNQLISEQLDNLKSYKTL